MGELRQGIERIQRRAAKKAAELNSWLHTTLEAYEERILPIDRSVAEEWGTYERSRSAARYRWFTRCNSQNLWAVFRDAQYEGRRPYRRDLSESVFLTAGSFSLCLPLCLFPAPVSHQRKTEAGFRP